jgi:DNA-binding NarL/FixJ family response regulator
MSLKILIVDDHPVVREGLRAGLGAQPELIVVGEAVRGSEAVTLAQQLLPDIILMDFSLPDMTGAEATRQIIAAIPSAAVIVFSVNVNRKCVDESLEAGARGYLTKGTSLQEIVRAIGVVKAGKLCLGPDVATEIMEAYRSGIVTAGPLQQPAPIYSPREKQLLHLVAEGRRNKEIASELAISVKTVEASRSRLMKKLHCTSTADLVRHAIRNGLARP